MTPLAMRVARELILPVKDRRFVDPAGVLRSMDDLHCFEMTAVDHLVDDFVANHVPHHVDPRLMFMPAARCWFETRLSGGSRLAWHVDTVANMPGGIVVRHVAEHPDFASLEMRYGNSLVSPIPLRNNDETISFFSLIAMLHCINQPKIIARSVHQPHRGLARKLAKAEGGFALRPWTELTIEGFAVGRELGAEGEVRASSGRKCHHFVRAHIRQANGQFVRAHWRGDPGLGLKQTKYRVVPPEGGVA